MNRRTKPTAGTPLKIEILTRLSMVQTESLIQQICASQSDSIDVWLAKEIGPYLFKDTRVASLLAVARRLGKRVRVIDWSAKPTDDHLSELFGTTIEGLACLEFAHEVVDSQKSDLLPRIQHLRIQAIEKKGILETTGGKVLTFLAFDPELPTPIGFVGIHGKDAFVTRLLSARKDFFEIGVGQGFSGRTHRTADQIVASLIYELWQNTIRHGRFDEQHQQIRGMRYLRLHKHVGGQFEAERFLNRADGFAELRRYIEAIIKGSTQYKLLEVSIGDSGIGIVDRFLATRPEFREAVQNRADHAPMINRIISQNLSSNLHQPGAGHGLELALGAVRKLKGFISIRTGSSWVYHDSLDPESTRNNPLLLPVVRHDEQLASIGTQINLLYPLMELGN